MLFTRYQSSKWVKDINEFKKTYGKRVKYIKSHHLILEELPEKLKSRGREAQKIAEKIIKFGRRKHSQEELDKYFDEIKAIKKQT